MSADLFISYAWTSLEHRQWVRLLASQMKAIGYDVLIDVDVDYGDSLTGFMRRVIEARHVLLVVDDNYASRADGLPASGVGIETRWISEAHPKKPANWASILLKDNPAGRLPEWLADQQPKYHDFRARISDDGFPGSEQVEELWRWIEDLPANRDKAPTAKSLRERARRLERLDIQRDPSNWRDPSLSGEIHFPYEQAPGKTYRVGYGTYEFALMVSSRSTRTVAIYSDPVKAVGLVRPTTAPSDDLEAHLHAGRVIDAAPGDVVVLMNKHGVLCRVEIINVQHELNEPRYTPPHIDFRFDVVTSS